MVDIKEKLEKLLEAKGWTKFMLSKKSGLGDATVTRIFYGKVSPRVDTLNEICKALGISLSDFFKEDITDDDEFFIVTSYKSLDENSKNIIKLIFALLKK